MRYCGLASHLLCIWSMAWSLGWLNNHQIVGTMADKKNWMRCNQEDAVRSEAGLSQGRVFYEFHVKGQLNSNWSDWLEDMEVKLLENGEMIFFGPIVDQAALMGILNKLNRLNLALRSLHIV